MRSSASGIFALVILLAAGALVQTRGKEKPPQLRSVHGQVVDKDENPIGSAVIYLENMSTKNVQSHISEDSGDYNFSGLDPNVDYQIYAEHGDMISSTHTISSFDSRMDVNLEIKVDRPKPAK
jgi:hypothetical protein